MPGSRTRARCLSGVAVAAVVLAGCSGDEDAPGAGPAEVTQSPTSSPEPTTEVHPTTEAPADVEPTTQAPVDVEPTTEEPTTEEPTTEEPVAIEVPENADAWVAESGFEFDPDPRVALFERWIIELAISANASDYDRQEWLELGNQHFYDQREYYFEADSGLIFPGPVPFAITGFGDVEGWEVLELCMVSRGFAVDAETGEPRTDARLRSDDVYLEIVDGGGYLYHGVYEGEESRCDGLDVEEFTW